MAAVTQAVAVCISSTKQAIQPFSADGQRLRTSAVLLGGQRRRGNSGKHRASAMCTPSTFAFRSRASAAFKIQTASPQHHGLFTDQANDDRTRSVAVQASTDEAQQTPVSSSNGAEEAANGKSSAGQNGNGVSANPFTKGKLSAKLAAKSASQPAEDTQKKLNPILSPSASRPSPGSTSQSTSASTATPKAPPAPPPKAFGSAARSPFETLSKTSSPPAARPAVKPSPGAPAPSSVRPTPSFSGKGKKLMAAFKAGDKFDNKIKIGQPKAPSSIFEDVRRTPEEIEAEKWRFSLNQGQILLILSFFASSALMFGTVWVVWKLGAIHFNEY